MLDLISKISELDDKRIDNYVREWGVEDGYIGNEEYLTYWAESKKKLFHLLGGNLIYRRPYSYEKSELQLAQELAELWRTCKFKNAFQDTWYDMFNNGKIDTELYHSVNVLFNHNTIVKDTVPMAIKYKAPDAKKTLQIQIGMKPVRAMQKIIQYFNLTELNDAYEEFRLKHSLVLNEKIVKGNLCISIHPLDFMTMSDNRNGWSSCMSWMKNGCYHEGTIEMMNSNNVVCAYLDSKDKFGFGREEAEGHRGDEWTWENKKWRQLFYVTKDIIMGGKSYPYVNDDMTQTVLSTLRELANENLHWTYSFGPELYQDMKHTGTLYRMDRNRRWIQYGTAKKHNILFDTKGMYNDMFNDPKTEYWCVRNKVKKAKMISVSGKAPCLCCMDSIVDLDNYYYYDECAYNDRYEGAGRLLCWHCNSDRYCSFCDSEQSYYTLRKTDDGTYLCGECWAASVKECPECGKSFYVNGNIRNVPKIRVTDKPLCLQQVRRGEGVVDACLCKDCIDKNLEDGTIVKETIYADKTIQYWSWDLQQELMFFAGVHEDDIEFVNKYDIKNLAPAKYEKQN